ncbi:hypothetical protein [Nonomuraea sp. KM88]|uniref:hypothetical protein n=1 Tax=Nonomuraea sp. KM88 TaxID=3457427 RepID=UPI003FCD1A09
MMIRQSQVERLKAAVRAYERALRYGTSKEQARCHAVLNAAYRNSSRDEINAALT